MDKPTEAELEAEFQNALASYKATKSKKDWDKMFLLVQNACNAFLGKKLRNVYRPDFDDIVMEATIKVMQTIKNKLTKENFEVRRLINYVSLPAYFTLYNPKRAFEDKLINETDLVLYNDLSVFGKSIGDEDEDELPS